MNENPYAPPVDAGPPATALAPSGVRWFSPRQIGVCSFFGGPLAGTILLWMNSRAARWSMREAWLGLGGTVAILVIASRLSGNSSYGLGFVGAVTLHALAKLQQANYPQARPRPLPRRGWILLGVVLGAIFLTLLVAVIAGVVAQSVEGNSLPE